MPSIYGLFDPRRPRFQDCQYIGQTQTPLAKRLSGHLGDATRHSQRAVCVWILQLLDEGITPLIISLQQTTLEALDICEKNWIAFARRQGCLLLNGNGGGSGKRTVPYAPRRKCQVDDCNKPIVAYGFCDPHYRTWKRYGDPLGYSLWAAPAEERFWHYVDQNGPEYLDLGNCWLWTGSLSGRYGAFTAGNKSFSAHKWLWEQTNGSVPTGLELTHLCPFTHCVNPDHMEATSHGEVVRRGRLSEMTRARHAATTHCPQGHPYDEENTAWREKNGYRQRDCRACQREANRRCYEKRRLAIGAEVRPYAPQGPRKSYAQDGES